MTNTMFMFYNSMPSMEYNTEVTVTLLITYFIKS